MLKLFFFLMFDLKRRGEGKGREGKWTTSKALGREVPRKRSHRTDEIGGLFLQWCCLPGTPVGPRFWRSVVTLFSRYRISSFITPRTGHQLLRHDVDHSDQISS